MGDHSAADKIDMRGNEAPDTSNRFPWPEAYDFVLKTFHFAIGPNQGD